MHLAKGALIIHNTITTTKYKTSFKKCKKIDLHTLEFTAT